VPSDFEAAFTIGLAMYRAGGWEALKAKRIRASAQTRQPVSAVGTNGETTHPPPPGKKRAVGFPVLRCGRRGDDRQRYRQAMGSPEPGVGGSIAGAVGLTGRSRCGGLTAGWVHGFRVAESEYPADPRLAKRGKSGDLLRSESGVPLTTQRAAQARPAGQTHDRARHGTTLQLI